jgi:hypothetical protein
LSGIAAKMSGIAAEWSKGIASRMFERHCRQDERHSRRMVKRPIATTRSSGIAAKMSGIAAEWMSGITAKRNVWHCQWSGIAAEWMSGFAAEWQSGATPCNSLWNVHFVLARIQSKSCRVAIGNSDPSILRELSAMERLLDGELPLQLARQRDRDVTGARH